MNYSRAFVRLNWVALILIYLVVVAGSFVRITGSGMGCPDWPKCFGEWIPPTTDENLPENYKDIYSEKRAKKVEKFSNFLSRIGLEETAEKLENDPNLLVEQDFNGRKTWTEYVNRLVGFLSGNALLLAFLWILLKYRKRKLILLTFVNLILMGIQAWFGSIVVASNLVPWTITVHMFLALVIIGIQLYVIRMISPSQQTNLSVDKWVRYLLILCFGITVYQMFLGTQVREYIDELIKMGYNQSEWVEMVGMPFYIHRSFSWGVLILLTYVAWRNEKANKYAPIRWLYVVLALELITGVLLAYAEMPGIARTAHLVFASAMFGIITMLMFRAKSARLDN
jgi:cytochrome c oxidase assembly protein subunit 15